MTTAIAQRVKKHRDALRAAGLRPVQSWLPDTRNSDFLAECLRQSLLLAKGAEHEADTLRWLEQVADTDAWR